MADSKPETVRGTIGDAVVVTSVENAERLGAQFTPEGAKTAAKKVAAPRKSS